MKTNALLLLALLLPAQAQDANIQQPKPATAVNATEQRKLRESKEAEEILKEKPVVFYSGFLTELKRSQDKAKLLSLRQPLDPKNDYKNVYYEIGTGRPKGFTLFSLDF